MDMSASYDGLHLCTIADDHSLKVFDVVNFGNYCFLLSSYNHAYVHVYVYVHIYI